MWVKSKERQDEWISRERAVRRVLRLEESWGTGVGNKLDRKIWRNGKRDSIFAVRFGGKVL